MIQAGNVYAEDLQPVFAALGSDKAGKLLVSLEALREEVMRNAEQTRAYFTDR